MFVAHARTVPALVAALVVGTCAPCAFAQLPGSTTLSTAGTTEQGLTSYLEKLQKAVQADDRASVAKLVSFPLRAWNGKTDAIIKDKKQFLAQYTAIFSTSLKKTIGAARLENSWANYQGVMFESGRFWLRPDADGALRMVTTNAPIGG